MQELSHSVIAVTLMTPGPGDLALAKCFIICEAIFSVPTLSKMLLKLTLIASYPYPNFPPEMTGLEVGMLQNSLEIFQEHKEELFLIPFMFPKNTPFSDY